MKAKTAKEVLTAMAWMIENVGWLRGLSYSYDNAWVGGPEQLPTDSPPTAMCIRGAWRLVEGDLKAKGAAWAALRQVCASPIHFNDVIATTQKDVLDLIGAAKASL